MNTPTGLSLLEAAMPRIALLFSDEEKLAEMEKILRSHYSSLMLITELEKLSELQIPFVLLTDTVDMVSRIAHLPPAPGTQIIIALNDQDSESTSAAFESGATSYVSHPFSADEVIAKMEKCLDAFRQTV